MGSCITNICDISGIQCHQEAQNRGGVFPICTSTVFRISGRRHADDFFVLPPEVFACWIPVWLAFFSDIPPEIPKRSQPQGPILPFPLARDQEACSQQRGPHRQCLLIPHPWALFRPSPHPLGALLRHENSGQLILLTSTQGRHFFPKKYMLCFS